ncbi:MAG: shikimate dehydrogenase [Methanomicrobiales archaeon]|nr:shikimate dehydrogenase [Methanomicrobiales archaeon]
MKIVIIGFRGTGKTVIGARLAERLGRSFIDTDTCIEEQEGMRVQELFAKRGEPFFRARERAVVQSLRHERSAVISTGGGIILEPTNIEALREGGTVFLLEAPREQVMTRIVGSGRPPLTALPLAEEIDLMLRQRQPLYRQAADFCLNTEGLTIEEVCDRIVALLSQGPISPSNRSALRAFIQKLPLSHEEAQTCTGLLDEVPINPTLRLCAVAGNPVSHSRSPPLFNHLFSIYRLNFYYTRIQWDVITDIIKAFRRLDMRGLSITIPFKELVMPFLDEVDENAAAIGAVNTVVQCGGSLVGYNTDWQGIREPLSHLQGCRATILGAGGAAAAAAFACRDLDMEVSILNRTPERGAKLAARFGCRWGALSDLPNCRSDVVINATPVGMEPDTSLPINPEDLKPGMTVFDLVYTPAETPLLQEAHARGCATISGVSMFLLQAKEQFRLFTGINVPLKRVEEAMG